MGERARAVAGSGPSFPSSPSAPDGLYPRAEDDDSRSGSKASLRARGDLRMVGLCLDSALVRPTSDVV